MDYVYALCSAAAAFAIITGLQWLWRANTKIRIDSTEWLGGKVTYDNVDFAATKALYFLHWLKSTELKLGDVCESKNLFTIESDDETGKLTFVGPDDLMAKFVELVREYLSREEFQCLRQA